MRRRVFAQKSGHLLDTRRAGAPGRDRARMSPASRRRGASGSPRQFGVSRAAAATFLALVVASACARPSFARGAPLDDESESWYADVEEFALDGPDAVQAHVASALRENRERPDYDAAVNPILPGGRVRDVAVAVAAARGDIRRPVSSAGLLGIGAGDGDDDDGDDDDGDDGARAPGPARPDDDRDEGSDDGAAWGRRDVLGGMIVVDDDDDDADVGPLPEGGRGAPPAQHRGRSLARASGTRSSTSSIADVARRARASRCGSAIASGAVASAGALPVDPREWAAAEDEETGLGVTEVPWMIAMEVGERRERERMDRLARAKANGANGASDEAEGGESNSAISSPATDDREAELEARYSELKRWVARKGGVVGVGVNVSRVVGKPGDGWGFVATDGGDGTDDGSKRGDVNTGESPTVVHPGDVVARVPIALALSHVAARTYRVDDAPVGDLLRRLFDQAPEYAMCMMLLHERFKLVHGLDSPWGPYVRTLSHVEPSVAVLRELRGTYADEARREWDARVKAAHEWITDVGCAGGLRQMCSRKPGRHGAGSGTFNRDDVRWALGVVRSRAVWIARRFGAGGGDSSSRRFPALVPLLDLLPHDGGAGGTTTLGVDNVVTVTAGSSFAPGAEVVVDRGTNSTDAEQLLAYHALAPGVNVDNAVRLNLPGAEIANAGVIRKVELLRTWRREMAMPPRGADLWRDARGLGLYGDGDEDEVRAMGDAARASAKKRRSLAALAAKGEGGRSGGAMTIEEELLLTDEARDPAEAAAKAAARIGVDLRLLDDDGDEYHDDDDDGEAYALYSAPNPDHPGGDDPALDHHRRSLARLAAQTAAAAAYADVSGGADYSGTRRELESGNPGGSANDRDETRSGADLEARSDGGNATRAALRSARAFFERGAPPPRGLDPLDLFLLRKGRLMSACGETRDFLITAAGPSDALMCATRVLLANETEVKALEGGGSDPHWSGDRMESASEIERLKKLGLMHEPFDAARPLSETNERAAIRRVASAATNILAGYGTTEEEDLERLGDVDPVVLGIVEDRHGDGRGVWSRDDSNPEKNASTHPGRSWPARVPGGVLASAVALRVRERRMLRGAVLALRDRAETLGALDFQVEEKERRRAERDAFERERAERIRELSRTFLEREVLASIDVDVVRPDSSSENDESSEESGIRREETTTITKTVTVRAGDDVESIVREFMAANSIDSTDAFASLKRTLLERVERGADARGVANNRRVGRCAVIVPDGRKVVVAPRVGEELSDVVRGFAEAYDVPPPLVPALAARVNASLAKRARRATLLTLDVVAPDGRSELVFDVVDGEQHDLVETAREWALAESVHPGAAVQVADAAFRALPPVIVAFPVDVPGRARRTIAIRDADEAAVRRTCEAFCEANDLGGGDATVDALVRGAMSRLNPGAVLVDADRRVREGGRAEEAGDEGAG